MATWFRFTARAAFAYPGYVFTPSERYMLIAEPFLETRLRESGVAVRDAADVPAWRGWEPPEEFVAGRPTLPVPRLPLAARPVLLIGRGLSANGCEERYPDAVRIGVNPWYEAAEVALDAAVSIDTGWLTKAGREIAYFGGVLLGGPKVAKANPRFHEISPSRDYFPDGTLMESATWAAAWILAQRPERLILSGFDFIGSGQIERRKRDTARAFAWFRQCFAPTPIEVDARCRFEVAA
jgi:hypothetical protein